MTAPTPAALSAALALIDASHPDSAGGCPMNVERAVFAVARASIELDRASAIGDVVAAYEERNRANAALCELASK